MIIWALKWGLIAVGLVTVLAYGMNYVYGDGPPTEIPSMRTKDSRTFQNADGSFTTEFRPNLNYLDGETWKPVNLDFSSERVPGDGVRNVEPDEVLTNYTRPGLVALLREKSLELTNPTTGVGIRWLLPGTARIEPNPANEKDRQKFTYIERGLIWEIHNTREGTKLQASVIAPRGLQTYVQGYELIGTRVPLKPRSDGLQGDGFFMPPPEVIDAEGTRYGPLTYKVTDTEVSFTFNDSVIPLRAYPYIIDPTTSFGATTSGSDGIVGTHGTSFYPALSASTTLDLTSTTGTVSIECDGASEYDVNHGLISIDTSALPDDAV